MMSQNIRSRRSVLAALALAATGTAVAAGSRSAFAATGPTPRASVFGWGYNQRGTIGDGSVQQRNAPVPTKFLPPNLVQVSIGDHASLAVDSDGSVWSWGRNYRAELGDGTKVQRLRPVPVRGIVGAASIGSGRDHGLAVLSNGKLMSWGFNTSGQLGDGTTTTRTTAVVVSGTAGATKAAGGGEYSVVVASP